MIDHVLPKERITAEKTNQIIDKANGLQTPSSRFVNTPNGTLTPPPDYTPGFSFFPVPEHILQTKHGASLQMTERGQTRNDDKYGTTQKMSWFCYLGPNTATLKSKVCPYEDIDSIWLGSETSSLFKEVTDNMIDSLSAVGNWVDVGAYDEESVKVAIVKIYASEQSQQPLPPKYAAVICGGDLDGFSQLLESDKYQQYDKAEQVDKHSYTIAALDNNDRVFQLGYGPDPFSSALDYPAVDSQISALQLSSLGEEVHIEVSGELSTETVYRDLFNFGLSGTVNASHLSGTDPGDIEFVMRESKTTQNSGKRVNYLKYSDLSAALQTNGVPVDTDVAAAQTSSLQTRDLGNGTKAEEMFNFHLSGTVGISLDNLSAYDIVVRNPNGGSPYVQYGKLSIDIYPDSEGNTSQKSVAWLRDDHELQLYKFNENGTSLPKKAINLSSDGFTPLLPSDYEFVLRKNGAGGEVTYANLSCCIPDLSALSGTSISGDANVYPFMEKSIETLSGELGKFHRLYNWYGYSADQSHVISAAFGETRYFPFQDGTGTATDLTNAAHILTRPRAGARDLHYDAYGIRLPKVSPTDVTQELYDLILSGGTDISAVRQVVIDTLDDSDAKAPLSSNLDDCFWPQGEDSSVCYGSSIGNSIKEQVIDLDGTKLKSTGNNSSSLDWSTGICVDSDGEQSITWNGRGLIDSNGVWAVDWENRQGYSSSNNVTIDWEDSQLVGNWSTNGNLTVGGNGSTLTIGSTTINETQLQQLLALLNAQ